MTIPESVRESAERIREMRRQSDEFDGGYPATDEGRTQSLFDHCAVAEWAIENLLNSDDDEPCSNRAFVSLASFFADSLHEFTDHYIAMVNGVRVYFYKGCDVRSSAIRVTDFGGMILRPSESQVRKLISALKGGVMNHGEAIKHAENVAEWMVTPNVEDACRNMPDDVFYSCHFAAREFLSMNKRLERLRVHCEKMTKHFMDTDIRGAMLSEFANKLQEAITGEIHWPEPQKEESGE